MKKFFKGALFVALGGMLLLSGCTPKPDPNPGPNPGPATKTHNSETRVLQLATSALDGNFNPFFYTSGNDGNIISLTQLGFLTTDAEGHVTCGENEATVALDYTTTMYDTKQVGTGNVTASGSMDGRTEYEFLIKKGIKYSDGVELTVKDVLFNLYVYLDPAYTGSATIYSTDIQGLNAYRLQDSQAGDDSNAASELEKGFTEAAQQRVNAIIEWADDKGDISNEPSDPDVAADYAAVKELLKDELTSDWNTLETGWYESFKDSYSFTAAWQAYLFNAGLVTVQTSKDVGSGAEVKLYNDKNGNGQKDTGEPYYTTLDAPVSNPSADPEDQQYISGIADATTESKVQKYMSDHDCARDIAVTALQKEYCVGIAHTTLSDKSEIADVLTYWATATKAIEHFAGEARTDYYDGIKAGGEMAVPSISGITTRKASVFNGKQLDGEYDVLKVVINGVDPKALFNFGFAVAPLHYYAGVFSKDGIDYSDGTNFGVCLGDGDYFKQVLQDTAKNKLPVGAGAYKASTSDGGKTAPTADTFYQNYIAYFERNTYFHTVGEKIENAKIKYVNYKVMRDDQIMDALEQKAIDYGMPNATTSNVNKVGDNSFLSSVDYRTNGYGYVGFNPKFIPEYKIRQAMMKAMDTAQTVKYYNSKLAEVIYRPMSMMSWAYPNNVKTLPEEVDYDMTSDDAEIKQLVADAGYVLENGVYTKRQHKDGMSNAKDGTKLKFTFTLAGETTDHPAYEMFVAAAARLNHIGFDITVVNSSTALRDMTSGNLHVWAAAWSSATDPDLYQVYHKDSKATSVNNWNYPNILKDSTGEWDYELEVIERLSTRIEDGRETLSEDSRKQIYADCLDMIMELAVELPTYQRSDLCVYNNTVIDSKTLVKDANCFIGLFDKIWEIDYV